MAKEIVTATLILIKDEENIIVFERNDPDEPLKHGRFELPGGGVEVGESIATAVARELFEETGIVALPDSLKFRGIHEHEWDHEDIHLVFHVFAYLYSGETIVLSSEHLSYSSMPVAEYLIHPCVLGDNAALVKKFF